MGRSGVATARSRCWIPLDEVGPDAIALGIKPGTQKNWTLQSHEDYYDMQPGDGLFFTNYTWHRSEPNRSGETLMFYAVAYQLTKEAIKARDRLT